MNLKFGMMESEETLAVVNLANYGFETEAFQPTYITNSETLCGWKEIDYQVYKIFYLVCNMKYFNHL